jgi:tripartite ATP-independent transporter DctP family solute receptor
VALGTLQFLVIKLREQRPWKVEKNGFTSGFRVLQLPKKNISKRGRKMMLKKFRFLVLAMVLVLVSVSCTTFAAKKPLKLIFGHTWAADHFYCKGDLYFKELVEKNSKGQILIDYFPGSQLGNETEIYQATRSGAQQMCLAAGGSFGIWWPKLLTLELPYVIRNYDHQLKVAQKMNFLIDPEEMGAKTGVRFLSIRCAKPRQLTSKRPVKNLEDLKGLKIRVGENPLQIAIWKTLGAIPIAMPGSDIYTALATGTIDAQENTFDTNYANKIHEQAKYCTLTAHMRNYNVMVINNKFWKSLTAAQRKIIQNAADKSTQYMVKAGKENEEEYYNLLVKAGVQFIKTDLDPWIKKVKPVWKEFGDMEFIEKIQAIK